MTNTTPQHQPTTMGEPILTEAADHRAAALPFSNGIRDEASVTRNADGTVTIALLMAVVDEEDGPWPTEGMGELTLPAAVWDHLKGLA